MKTEYAPSGIIDVVLTEETLLPCPFCGCEDIDLSHTWTAAYWVECGVCGARLDSPETGDDHRSDKDHLRSAASAVVAWNTRKPPPDILSAARSAFMTLSRPAVYPEDLEAVRSGLREAINKATQS